MTNYEFFTTVELLIVIPVLRNGPTLHGHGFTGTAAVDSYFHSTFLLILIMLISAIDSYRFIRGRHFVFFCCQNGRQY